MIRVICGFTLFFWFEVWWVWKNRKLRAVYDVGMGIKREKRSPSSSTSPCAHLRAAYNNCFNRWYSEKFLKGHWDKEECVSEWQKYRDCLSQHLDDKHLSRCLEAEGIVDLTDQTNSKSQTGV